MKPWIAMAVLALVIACAVNPLDSSPVQGPTSTGAASSANPFPQAVVGPDGKLVASTGTSTGAAGVAHTAMVLNTAKIGDCTTPAGDGGTLSLTPNSRYRCVARNNAVCLNNGAAVTTCSLTAALAPNGAYVPADAPEEFSFSDTPLPDGGVRGASIIYLSTPSGTACFSCNLLSPQ